MKVLRFMRGLLCIVLVLIGVIPASVAESRLAHSSTSSAEPTWNPPYLARRNVSLRSTSGDILTTSPLEGTHDASVGYTLFRNEDFVAHLWGGSLANALISTLYVSQSSGQDSFSCTTRNDPCKTIGAAIGKAAVPPAHTFIEIDPGTYTEQLNIQKNVDLIGDDTQTTVIDANGVQSFVIKINGAPPGITVRFANLTIKNSGGSGTGLISTGNAQVTINRSVIRDHISKYNDGGILNSGIMTITDSIISDNVARGEQHPSGYPTNGGGGGITNNGSLTIIRSTISGNTAVMGAGIANGGTLIVIDSTIRDNYAHDMIGNRGGTGGGIESTGPLTITHSTIDHNSANGYGGGIYNISAPLVLTNSTVSNNSSVGDGAGIHNNGGTITVTNSTISTNTARPANSRLNRGGAIWNEGGTGTLVSSTIYHNSAGGAGGIGSSNERSPFSLHNTLLAGNSAAIAPDCSGTHISLSYNLIGIDSGCVMRRTPSDRIGTSSQPIAPKLGRLQDNGGRTLTHMPEPRSPVINAGSPNACLDAQGRSIAHDQRGAPRLLQGRCDIGAYETQYDIRESGMNLATDTWGFLNISGHNNYADFYAVFGEPTIAHVKTITNTGIITAAGMLNLPFSLTDRQIKATLPFSLSLPYTGTDLIVPHLNALLYETIVVSTTYKDAHIRRTGTALTAGLCVGMTGTVADFQAGRLNPVNYGGPPVSAIALSDRVRSLIQQTHMRQMSAEVLRYLAGPGRKDNVKQYADDLANWQSLQRVPSTEVFGFSNGAGEQQHFIPEIIGLVNHEGEPNQRCADAEVGHAVLPTGIVRQITPFLYRIYVYDPNYPPTPPENAEDHYIEIVNVNNTWQWRYELAPRTASQPGLTWQGLTLYSLPLDMLHGPATLPTDQAEGVMLVNGGQRGAWGTLSRFGGQRGAWGDLGDGQIIGCVPSEDGKDVFFKQTIHTSLRLPSLRIPTFYIPTSEIQKAGQLTFHSQGGDLSDMTIIGKDTVIGYLGTAITQTLDSLTVDPHLQTVSLHTNDSQQTKQITLYQMHESEPDANGVSETRVVAVSNATLLAGEALTMTVSKDSQGNVTAVSITNTSALPKIADIGFTAVGSNGLSQIVYSQQPIAAGARQIYLPNNWMALSATPVTVEIHRDDNGIPDEVKVLQPFPAPSSTVLDRFTRPDGPLGQQWSGSVGGYALRNGRVQVFGGGPIYWQPSQAGVDQEVFVTMTAVDDQANEQDLLLKVQGETRPDWRNGVIEVLYDAQANAGMGAVRVETWRPQATDWMRYPNIPLTLQNGDQFGARAHANGMVEIYKNRQLVGMVTLTAEDQRFFNSKGGWIGLWSIRAPGAIVDDFGGGTIRSYMASGITRQEQD